MRTTRPFVFVLPVLLWLAPAFRAGAHDFWIEPSSFRPSSGQPLLLRLRVGELFLGDPVPRNDARLRRFETRSATASQPVPGENGADPAGRTTLHGDEGEVVVVFESSPSFTTMTPELFSLYLEQEGLTAIAAERQARGIAPGSQGATDAFSRHAKALLEGPAPGGAEGAFATRQALELELRPLATPRVGGFAVELSFRGRPLADTQVVAIPRRRPQDAQTTRSDREGRASFELVPGEWLIKAVHVLPRADFERLAVSDAGDADYRSYWASLTFSLAAGQDPRSPR